MNIPEEEKEKIAPGIADRLFKLLNSVLTEGKIIPKAYHPVILNLVKPYLLKTTDEELSKIIFDLRDKLIPWVLYDKDFSK